MKWYGKAFVGDGADAVDRSELDPWQKFAHDVVMDGDRLGSDEDDVIDLPGARPGAKAAPKKAV